MNFKSIKSATLVISCFLLSLLAGCIGNDSVDLSGDWANDEVGTLTLKQSGSILSAEQKDPAFQAFFGPKMFEGKIVDGVLTGKIATALDTSKQTFCGANWGNWSDIELKVSPDGIALEGRWMRNKKSTSEKGCPIISSEWAPIKLDRPKGQPPVQFNASPKWLPPLLMTLGFVFAVLIRMAYVNYLVGPKKRSPNAASSAGWALFLGSFAGVSAVSLALTGREYSSPQIWAPFAIISLICLITTFIVSVRR